MKNLIFIMFLLIGTNAFGQSIQKSEKSVAALLPDGYVVFEEIRGDLNKDGQTDYVFIIKGTSKDGFVEDEYRGELDRNRRGIIIVFKNEDQYELVLDNRDCFSSENEDGGDYFPPELSVSINKGNLFVQYAHGRYGYWGYNFRYQNSDFELIGYDNDENRGPVVERSVSINLMTKKMLIRENVNQDAEGGGEKFKETWKKIVVEKPIKLRDIDDFDGLHADNLLGLVK